jgi:adenine-specific DNA methylase
MIPKSCKRLAEVDFPIAEVSRHAAREKSIRHGHPSTLHLWWARRPLASSRAVLLALLWPDPCDPLCPTEFKAKAREMLPQLLGRIGPADEDLRKALLTFIADFANWDNAAHSTYLEVSRALVKAAYAPADGSPYEPPLVVDPFAGGGSIPLEALRLGCETFASDLNPVACLILKVMLEDIPRHGPKLAKELRRVGAEIKKQAEQELAELYPKDLDGATPIAYLWARTVRCESPNCGAEIPLLRSFWLCKKAKRRLALRHRVVRHAGEPPRVEFEVFEPKAEKDVADGTVARAKATCVCCGAVLPPERVRAQLAAQRGGADVIFDAKGRRTAGARMLAVVILRPGEQGRSYRLPTERDYEAICRATERIQDGRTPPMPNGLTPFPDEAIPRTELRRISVPLYGVKRFRDMFTARQLLALSELARRIAGTMADAPAINHLLALCLGKTADLNNANTPWKPDAECPVHTLARHDIPASWDFAEAAPFGEASGSFFSAYERTMSSIAPSYVEATHGVTVQPADASAHPLPDESASVWFTDPPYYDAVPYAHLSDFFYVWERRALSDPAVFGSSTLAPKDNECVVDRPHSAAPNAKTTAHFEAAIRKAMAEGLRVTRKDGVAGVVFAHKTTEGWEALLSGMIDSGWVISASWPIATEMGSRLNARGNASLATSVHLICRPRPDNAGVGDWAAVLRELPPRVGDWMERLQGEGVRGADLVFACIGPALEIFSRYAKVETADGREVALAEYLEKVWEVVGRSALAQVLGTAEAKARNGAAGAVEEDARLTALFLWTLQSTDSEEAHRGDAESAEKEEGEEAEEDDDEEGASRGKAKGFTLVFDVVRRFAQPLGIDLPKWEGRVIETKKGLVRLLPIAERAKQLFGEDGAQAVAARLEQETAIGTNPLQGMLFPEMEAIPKARGRGRGSLGGVEISDESLAAAREATTLDRVHAAMLLQAGGRTNALRALLKAEQERGSDFLRLANAFSALYPRGSEEKRLIDAMLMAMPR